MFKAAGVGPAAVFANIEPVPMRVGLPYPVEESPNEW